VFRHCIFVEIHAIQIQYEIHEIYSLGDATIMLIGVVSFLREYRAQAAVRYHFSFACAPSTQTVVESRPIGTETVNLAFAFDKVIPQKLPKRGA